MGRRAVTYSIGGIKVQITSHCVQGLYDDSILAAFEAEGPADMCVDIVAADPPSREGAQRLHDLGSWIYAYRYKDQLLVGFRIKDPGDTFPYLAMDVSELAALARFYVRPEGIEAAGFLHPFQRPAAEIFLLHCLSTRHGTMFHSCGVDDCGRGYLFIGPSSAGKTTMARLWRETANVPVLSDENVIVRRAGEDFLLYGTPWPGDGGTYHTGSCKLECIFFIEHAPANSLERVHGTAAVAPMLLQGFPQFWHEQRTRTMLPLIADLANQVSCYRLGFVPDDRVVDYIRSAATSIATSSTAVC
jgi:hypothetical protein